MKQAIKQAQNLLLLFPNFTNPLNQIYEHEMQILQNTFHKFQEALQAFANVTITTFFLGVGFLFL